MFFILSRKCWLPKISHVGPLLATWALAHEHFQAVDWHLFSPHLPRPFRRWHVGRLGFGGHVFLVYPVPTVDGRFFWLISWGWYFFNIFFNPIIYYTCCLKHFTRWCKSSFINNGITVLLGSCQNAGRQEDVVKVQVGSWRLRLGFVKVQVGFHS